MKKLLLVGILAVIAGCAREQAEMHDVGGGLRVDAAVVPAEPKVGNNVMRLRIEDSAGKPVRGARVDALVFMAAMGAMPRMESKPALPEKAPGVYEGTFGLAMGGSWDVDLSIAPPSGAPTRIALRLTVGVPGVTWVTDEATGGSALADSSVGAVVLTEARRQEIGVTTAPVAVRDLDYTRRASGRVTYDESRRAEVTLKYQGYVRTLAADFTGLAVRKGQVLLTVYSPDLYSAEREFLEAIAVRDSMSKGPAQDRAADLAAAARQRLALWDLSAGQIAALEKSRKPSEAVAVLSPVSGVITDKMVVQGSAVVPGQTLFKIAPIDPIWILCDVYPYELPFLKVGDKATVTLPAGGRAVRGGRISFIYPFLESETRTGQVRIEVANGDRALLPDQLVDVNIAIPLGKRLAVPASAVLFNGDRRLVFVDAGGGRLEPREVKLGAKADDWYAVESGLKAGDTVVTSGNFLVAAESRLRAPESAP
ncbi:MAG TPA: FixH family protein [Candidatus Eisenbacteria bacterium]|nr:FixH family protein [Candidatus Eisenbacteria bacterium]